MAVPRTKPSVFEGRRRRLLERNLGPVVVPSGSPQARNYPANPYPFRATSHFLYFVGQSMADAALLFANGEASLFVAAAPRDHALWHGPSPSFEDLRSRLGLAAVLPLDQLGPSLDRAGGRASAATLPPQDARSAEWLSGILGRAIQPGTGAAPDADQDARLADAVIDLRLVHDAAALEQIRAATRITAGAHVAGMRASATAQTETEVLAAMEAELARAGLVDAYGPIVSVHGEVLHNPCHDNRLAPGDLILADVGGETPEGWAADITRTWPVSGAFSPTQRAAYEIVLETQRVAIARVRPGARYRDIHAAACRTLVEGLRELGVFRGDVDGLLDRGAAALFFPHGIGHLLGLDVHDMEDLGDRAGYAKGRTRPTGFGERYLRLDRDLRPGMVVTIEPGFYQVSAILEAAVYTSALGQDLDRTALGRFSDVRGIRIEDDVLCTEGDPEVLTLGAPKAADEVEAVVTGRG